MDKETKKMIDELINRPTTPTLYDNRLIDGEKITMLIIEDMIAHGISTVSTEQLDRNSSCSTITLHKHLRNLVDKNYIERVGRGKYTIKQIF